MNTTVNKFYLLVTLGRSLDSYHSEHKQLHLLGSCFYTNDYNFNNLVTNTNRRHLIIRLVMSDMYEISVRWSKDKFACELQFDLFYFLSIFSSFKFEDINEHLLSALSSLNIDSEYYREMKKVENLMLHSLFVFEGINWFTLQVLFKHFNIILSGGTISKRNVLTTSQFLLSKYLSDLGYGSQDVFNSFSTLRKESKNEIDLGLGVFSANFVLAKESMIVRLTDFFKLAIERLNVSISENESEIKNKEAQIQALNLEISLVEIKLSKDKTVLSKRIFGIKRAIEKIRIFVDTIKDSILKTEADKSLILSEINDLANLSYDDLKIKYIRLCYNPKIKDAASKLKKLMLILRKQNFNKDSNNKKSNLHSIKSSFNHHKVRRDYHTTER